MKVSDNHGLDSIDPSILFTDSLESLFFIYRMIGPSSSHLETAR